MHNQNNRELKMCTYQINYQGNNSKVRARSIFHAISKFQEKNNIIVRYRVLCEDGFPLVLDGFFLSYGKNFKRSKDLVDISLFRA